MFPSKSPGQTSRWSLQHIENKIKASKTWTWQTLHKHKKIQILKSKILKYIQNHTNTYEYWILYRYHLFHLVPLAFLRHVKLGIAEMFVLVSWVFQCMGPRRPRPGERWKRPPEAGGLMMQIDRDINKETSNDIVQAMTMILACIKLWYIHVYIYTLYVNTSENWNIFLP